MIAFLVENWETLGVAGVLLVVGIWYFIHQVNRQNKREDKREERDIKREEKVSNMVDSSLKTIETTTTKNKAYNKQIAIIQERTLQVMDAHRAEANGHNKQITEIIRNTLEMSNGGNPLIKKILKRLDKIEKPLDK